MQLLAASMTCAVLPGYPLLLVRFLPFLIALPACLPGLQAKEPVLWRAVRFGAVLENVSFDEDFEAARITENTRASYPVEHIGGCGSQYCRAVQLRC
jgi:hypothetical protein